MKEKEAALTKVKQNEDEAMKRVKVIIICCQSYCPSVDYGHLIIFKKIIFLIIYLSIEY